MRLFAHPAIDREKIVMGIGKIGDIIYVGKLNVHHQRLAMKISEVYQES